MIKNMLNRKNVVIALFVCFLAGATQCVSVWFNIQAAALSEQTKIEEEPGEPEISLPEEETAPIAAAMTEAGPAAETSEAEEMQDMSLPEAEEGFVPNVVQLNLAYVYPEGADKSIALNSMAGGVFRSIVEKDENWMNFLYELSDTSPEMTANSLSISRDSVMGLYNCKDESHDPENPDTWTVNSFNRVNIILKDGDGNLLSGYSNAIQIMSMASVFTWYDDMEDEAAFLRYAKHLWDKSHSYRVSLGNVYYCEGCSRQDSEELATDSDAHEEVFDEEIACPGHIDLNIQATVIGMKERNNLFSIDSTGNDKSNISEDGWEGWNTYTKSYATRLSEQDWYERYGLSISSFSMRHQLTESEVEEYMSELPANLSAEKRELVRFALSSVGRIPYYWGGKPSASGYTANNFGTLINPDEKGRILRGLDCSGWISWVYWSVTGSRLAYESTSGLTSCGTPISRDELEPGDIIIRTGADSHIIMFLSWEADGKIRCINETSGNINNVTISVREADWPYYIRLIN